MGLSASEMSQYVQYCADYLCQQLTLDTGAPMAPIFGAENPYAWMSLQSLRPKSNFFEAHEGSYVFSQGSPSEASRESAFDEDI